MLSQTTHLVILAALNQLDRVKDIVLAQFEELYPTFIDYSTIANLTNQHTSNSISPDPLVLLPLEFKRLTDCESELQAGRENPSNYLPTDTVPGFFCEVHTPSPNIYF